MFQVYALREKNACNRDIFTTLFVFTENQKQSKCVAVVEWFNLFGELFRGIEYGGLKFWAYICTRHMPVHTHPRRHTFQKKKKKTNKAKL